MSSDTLTFNDRWDVTFSDGACVSSITERLVHTDLVIKNLSSSFTNAQLQAEIARFGGGASVYRDSRRKRARVRFLDAAVAHAALVELDNKRLGLSRVETGFDRSKDTHWIEDGLLLVWDTCQTSAQVSFANATDATEALTLNRALFQGRRLRVIQDDALTLTVEDLPALFEDDDLLTFFTASSVTVTRDYGEDLDTNNLLQLLIREQPGCANLHLVPLMTELGQGAGWIKMYNDVQAAEVSKEIRGLRPIFLAGSIVLANRAQAVVWKLSGQHYAAVEAQLDDIELEGAFLQYIVNSEDEIEVRVVSADSRKLRNAKSVLDVVINGERWLEEGRVVWDRHWVTEEGRKYIEEVNEVSAAYVHVNYLERTISISGQKEGRECAKFMLQGRLDELDRSQHQIRLPKELMEIFLEIGLPRLVHRLTFFDSTVGKLTDVEFKGSDAARQDLNRVLDQCATELQMRSLTERPTCPVCMTEVVEPLRLECRHTYCTDCLAHLVTSAAEFPIRCIAADCKSTPSLRVLQRIVSPSQYRQLLDTSFRTYLRGNTELHACPTVDCPQLWSASSITSQCPTCLARICVRCKVEEHSGMTCVEFQRSKSHHQAERSLATYRAAMGTRVKACPSCGTIVEKTEGCPHIHCIHCNAHWCWECARTMARADQVYAHIRRRHVWAAARWLAPINAV